MKSKLLTGVTAGLIFGAFPQTANAANVTVNTILDATVVTMPITTAQATTTAAVASVDATLLAVGKALESRQQETTAAMTQLMAHQNQTMHDLFAEFGAAQVRAQARYDYESNGSIDFCNGKDLGVALQQGRNVSDKLSNKVAEATIIRGRSFKRTSDIKTAFEGLDETKISPSLMFPHSGIYAQEDEAAARKLMELTRDPVPPLNLTGKEASTSAGLTYQHNRKIYEMKSLSPTQVSAEFETEYRGTIEYSEGLKQLWQNMGGQGEYPGAVDGKVSKVSSIDLMTRYLYENPNLYEDVFNQSNQTQLMRTMMFALVVQTELLNRIYHYNRHMANMMGQREKSEVNAEYIPLLNRWRDQARKEAVSEVSN